MIGPTCGWENEETAAVCSSCGTALRASAEAHCLPAGTRLAGGACTLGRVLGQGGFGITYLGSDVRLQRPVAVKEFCPDGCVRQGTTVVPAGRWTAATYTDARRSFLQEGQMLARFDHPGIVRVFAALEESSTAYVVMEYLRGRTLAALLRERGGRLSESEAVGCVRKAAEALEVIHAQDVLQRDVKPDNLRCPARRRPRSCRSGSGDAPTSRPGSASAGPHQLRPRRRDRGDASGGVLPIHGGT